VLWAKKKTRGPFKGELMYIGRLNEEGGIWCPSEEPICFGLGIVRNSVNSVLVPIRG